MPTKKCGFQWGGGQIHGWWLPHEGTLDLTFLYLHGNAANISQNLVWALALRDIGASVLMIDYRGYGLSSGPFPSEAQLYEDALAAWNYLLQEKGIPAEEVVTLRPFHRRCGGGRSGFPGAPGGVG